LGAWILHFIGMALHYPSILLYIPVLGLLYSFFFGYNYVGESTGFMDWAGIGKAIGQINYYMFHLFLGVGDEWEGVVVVYRIMQSKGIKFNCLPSLIESLKLGQTKKAHISSRKCILEAYGSIEAKFHDCVASNCLYTCEAVVVCVKQAAWTALMYINKGDDIL